jgi:hypothetical protein
MIASVCVFDANLERLFTNAGILYEEKLPMGVHKNSHGPTTYTRWKKVAGPMTERAATWFYLQNTLKGKRFI